MNDLRIFTRFQLAGNDQHRVGKGSFTPSLSSRSTGIRDSLPSYGSCCTNLSYYVYFRKLPMVKQCWELLPHCCQPFVPFPNTGFVALIPSPCPPNQSHTEQPEDLREFVSFKFTIIMYPTPNHWIKVLGNSYDAFKA